MLFGGDYIQVIPLSAMLGILLWADIAARTIMAPEDIPIGIVTGLVGGLSLFGYWKEIIFRTRNKAKTFPTSGYNIIDIH